MKRLAFLMVKISSQMITSYSLTVKFKTNSDLQLTITTD